MTSVRKKTSSEIFRTPRWLRGPPRSLRSIMNPEEVSIYRRMRKAIIQELRPGLRSAQNFVEYSAARRNMSG